ncbi:hypothetical protein [Boudabousia marimammalium]|uniref:Uncharacterized protein n=1 Tax=Boudabousia marimammalium TaxID=156892 RepID=A0A1Q5PS71_9ACTO|nr:hypothetical protein [Boudabousia marimammalium]OKL50434.1 hypothetical protein BM477_00190 [Boudabousia marimammalium]
MSKDKQIIEEMSPETNERISRAPMPSKGTLRRRQNLLIQFFKLIGFNFRILHIVTKEKLSNRH